MELSVCLDGQDLRATDGCIVLRDVTVRQALERVLSGQTVRRFQLGRVDYDVSAPWQTGGCTLLQDVNDLIEALPDACLDFDMTSIPWTVNVLRMDDAEAPSCELRLNRGIAAVDAETDMTDMATRLYPLGSGGLTVAQVNGGRDHIQRNTSLYGIKSAADRHDDVTDASVLLALSQAQLKKRARPAVSVTVDGYELSAATG